MTKPLARHAGLAGPHSVVLPRQLRQATPMPRLRHPPRTTHGPSNRPPKPLHS